ncbi:undecaprenyldiphospho-muramoylpentapeptide beta-N-acetylglucosaminyltransferase [Paenibacillus sp. NAIST15-1]|uniref:undecaprenyldiphospho-muramoylpentapeptide beta-N-acetylglucosaminyltransferase n=1 Tax=Paenibacillus sp. NAIST15-1 TaxID=1605994 RepID=UPI00093446CC|nr:undecaprenyldiphospho-muramoylpentapeptide beta-N-acetylglucosaminyltransferase [Paenibacillus sp. NAIST15-1]
MTRRILFTGGGTTGHVAVNLALIPKFINRGWEVRYIGSRHGIEAELIVGLDGVEYCKIATGKLRRYWDWNNVKDPFRVLKGTWQAYQYIRTYQPEVVFSKGGFVTVPVVIGAWLNRVPVIIHESDLTPGLANRMALPFATKVCVTFPETIEHVKQRKSIYVGAVVRSELLLGSRSRGLNACGFTRTKPVLLFMGGSQGSKRLNERIRSSLPKLLQQYQIIHLCGKGNIDPSITYRGYRQYEYMKEELGDALAAADLVISRAGSNAIFEYLKLQIPMLLIPLSMKASRGDQIQNARSFQSAGYCHVLLEEEMEGSAFIEAIHSAYANKEVMREKMRHYRQDDAIEQLLDVIHSVAER